MNTVANKPLNDINVDEFEGGGIRLRQFNGAFGSNCILVSDNSVNTFLKLFIARADVLRKAKPISSVICSAGCLDDCCCKCANQLELFKHPQNSLYDGAINESTGLFACMALAVEDGTNKAILFETPHGRCEMFCKRINTP